MTTVVHLLRHGEVFNPEGILYGRRSGYMLSDLGQQMADRVAEVVGDRDIIHVRSSPLERAQQTAGPVAKARGVEISLDERLIESSNVFEGKPFAGGGGAFRDPGTWIHLYNPFRPSWGEPYKQIVARMVAAVNDARREAEGHEAVVVSHQLPIWMTRMHAEGRRMMLHDPRRRQCTLCSLTSLWFEGDSLARVTYSEPAGDLIPLKDRGSPFSAGGASDDDKPPSGTST
jgi:broad specificity phosphatase PhoE